jgi:NAD-specific glutamate dehydrogenase
MSDKKIKVPDEMLEAAMRECRKGTTVYHTCRSALEAALLWLSENPSQPDEEQMDELVSRYSWLDKDSVRFGAREWQRVMFLAPEPIQTPEERCSNQARVPAPMPGRVGGGL